MQRPDRPLRIRRIHNETDGHFRRSLRDGKHIDGVAAKLTKDSARHADCVTHPRADDCNNRHILGGPHTVDVFIFELMDKCLLKRIQNRRSSVRRYSKTDGLF